MQNMQSFNTQRTKIVPIMLELCSMLLPTYYAPDYAGTVRASLFVRYYYGSSIFHFALSYDVSAGGTINFCDYFNKKNCTIRTISRFLFIIYSVQGKGY